MRTNDEGGPGEATQGARAWDARAATSKMRSIADHKRTGHGSDQRLRPLIHWATRAAHEAFARSYGRTDGAVDECLAFLREAPKVMGAVLDQTAADQRADGTFDRTLALRLGRAFAQGIHVALHRAWLDGRRSKETSPRRGGIARLVANSERGYRNHLLASRSACRAERADRLSKLFEEVVDTAFDKLAPLTAHVACLSSEDLDKGALGMRVARLGRETAMLSGALVVLRARLSSNRTRGTTADIARSRKKLTRNEPRLRAAARDLGQAALGDRVRVRGRIRETGWVPRPEKPYTRLHLEGTETEIRPHYKNLTRLGVQAGMAVWAAGKVESVLDGKAVIVEFEGPGQHAMECWEDWLADEVRSAYDLYPEVLFMEWEYPPPGGARLSTEVRGRVGRRTPKEG